MKILHSKIFQFCVFVSKRRNAKFVSSYELSYLSSRQSSSVYCNGLSDCLQGLSLPSCLLVPAISPTNLFRGLLLLAG